MKTLSLLGYLTVLAMSVATAESPYAGQEHRSIKSRSPQEIEALNNGEGMGFAKLAELNHFPGLTHRCPKKLRTTPSLRRNTFERAVYHRYLLYVE